MKKTLVFIMGYLLILIIMLFPVKAEKREIHIILDPGHGGNQSGAMAKDEERTLEKDLNLQIALLLKEELESYENVIVSFTRETDKDVDLDRRSEIAEEENADLLVSLHNNALGDNSKYDHGSFVIASKGNYRKVLAKREQNLACNILNELSKLGLKDQGILLRESEEGETYPNGEKADYYRIIKAGINNNRMQILIEHAYIDNKNDFEQFLSTNEALSRLAEADAKGIARYYGLKSKRTGKALKKLNNYLEKKVLFLPNEEPEERYEIYYPDSIKLSYFHHL